MSAVMRIKELHKRKQRKFKLKSLRRRYNAAKSEDEKNAVLDKVRKVSPDLSMELFSSTAQR